MNDTKTQPLALHPDGIGAQNQHVLDSLAAAYRACLDLAERGYTVLNVQIGLRNPIIRIQSEPRCRHLHGAIKGIHGTARGREATWCVRHKGAQIEWRAEQ